MKDREPSISRDERRGAFRADVPACLSIDVPMALSVMPLQREDGGRLPWQWDELAVTPDVVKAMVAERELLVHDPLVVQLLTRIDWLLTTLLKTLGKSGLGGEAIPRFTNVNLSATGIRFWADHEYPIGTELRLRLILRPFVPIQAVGKVVRVGAKQKEQERRYETAVTFVQIAEDDQEAIIRHLLRAQALTQRLRHTSASSSLGD